MNSLGEGIKQRDWGVRENYRHFPLPNSSHFQEVLWSQLFEKGSRFLMSVVCRTPEKQPIMKL